MNKINYIKLFNKEANNKLWNILLAKYQSLKQSSILVAYCSLPILCIIFGFMAIIGWFASLTLLFMDTRFTPHYMKTTINHEEMTIEQANEYLNSQEYRYKKSVSHGNMSNKKRKTIETTFDLLYATYKLPEPNIINEKHEIIVSNLSEIQLSITNTNTTIDKVSTNVDSIASYTNKKQIEEEEKEVQLENLRILQEKRVTTAHNREKGRNLTSFESTLSDIQLDILTDYCNKIPIFNRDIEKVEIKNILLCTHKKPLQVKNNKYVAMLFTNLYDKGFICKTWKSVATRYKCFVSPSNKPLNTNDLYMANFTSGLIDPHPFNLIEQCVEVILDNN